MLDLHYKIVRLSTQSAQAQQTAWPKQAETELEVEWRGACTCSPRGALRAPVTLGAARAAEQLHALHAVQLAYLFWVGG